MANGLLKKLKIELLPVDGGWLATQKRFTAFCSL